MLVTFFNERLQIAVIECCKQLTLMYYTDVITAQSLLQTSLLHSHYCTAFTIDVITAYVIAVDVFIADFVTADVIIADVITAQSLVYSHYCRRHYCIVITAQSVLHSHYCRRQPTWTPFNERRTCSDLRCRFLLSIVMYTAYFALLYQQYGVTRTTYLLTIHFRVEYPTSCCSLQAQRRTQTIDRVHFQLSIVTDRVHRLFIVIYLLQRNLSQFIAIYASVHLSIRLFDRTLCVTIISFYHRTNVNVM